MSKPFFRLYILVTAILVWLSLLITVLSGIVSPLTVIFDILAAIFAIMSYGLAREGWRTND